MRSAASKIGLAVLALSPASALADANTLVYGNVSGWTVRTDPSQEYRCFAEASYEGGSSIRIGFDTRDAALYVSIADSSWAAPARGETHAIELSFDDAAPRTFPAMAASAAHGFTLFIPDDHRAAFLEDFANGFSISAVYAGHEPVMLSLGGSLNALRLLDDCRAAMAKLARGSTP